MTVINKKTINTLAFVDTLFRIHSNEYSNNCRLIIINRV